MNKLWMEVLAPDHMQQGVSRKAQRKAALEFFNEVSGARKRLIGSRVLVRHGYRTKQDIVYWYAVYEDP